MSGRDADEPVLEAVALGCGGRAGEDLEPAVELQRVGGDRDRVLALGAQALGQRDRHRGLADPGRPEDRDDRWRAAAWRGVSSVAMSVRIGTGLSTAPRLPRGGARGGRRGARAALGGEPCDLAVVFASGTHLIAPEAMLEAVHEALAPERAGRLRRAAA